MLASLMFPPRPVPVPINGLRRNRRAPEPRCQTSWFLLLAAGLLLALVLGANASSRGNPSRVELWTDRSTLESGERYSVHLMPAEAGFVYLYSLDAQGMVRLLYPVQPVDGRGEVAAGRSFSIEPLIAGNLPGRERLVVVHTREYRRVKASRYEFLAPDPTDLKDIHFRMTRDPQELETYTELELIIDGPEWVEPVAEASVDSRPGIAVHGHYYDYWCDYCNLWHPTCSLSHCWCDWRVGGYYYGHYHHHHCSWWGPRHWWWDAPVVYVYVEGGSNWDYDSTPWRERDVWRRQRYYSQDWRELQVNLAEDQVPPRDDWPRKDAVFKDIDVRSRLKEARAIQPEPPKAPQVWSTDPSERPGTESLKRSPRAIEIPGTTAPAPKGSVTVPKRKAPTPAKPGVSPATPATPVPQVQPAPKTETKDEPAKKTRTLTTEQDGKKRKR